MWTFGNKRQPRTAQGPLLATYPARLRQLIYWYDDLSDWQRVQYAIAAGLFLLACGGYLLGLGSTMVLQRVQLEDASLSARALPTTSVPTAPVDPLAAVVTGSPSPVPTEAPAQVAPTATSAASAVPPFNGPVIAEPPAAPRNLPADVPAVAPVAPPRATATAARPRNLETSRPEPPAASVATSTPGTVRTTVPAPTAVRQPTPRGAGPTSRPTPPPTTPEPTLAAHPATPTPATGAAPTRAPTPAATPAKTPTVR